MKSSLILLVVNLIWGSFQINKQESFVSYTGYHPFHKWTGVSYEVELDTECTLVSTNCDAIFTIPLISFNSGNSNRDSNMIYHLNAFKYPNVVIHFKKINIPKIFDNTDILKIEGQVNFHNIKRIQRIPIHISNSDNFTNLTSEFYIDLEEFNIKPPSLLMIPTDNKIKINVNIKGFFNDNQ